MKKASETAQEIRLIALKQELKKLKEEIDALKEIYDFYNQYYTETVKNALVGQIAEVEKVKERTKKVEKMIELFFQVHKR